MQTCSVRILDRIHGLRHEIPSLGQEVALGTRKGRSEAFRRIPLRLACVRTWYGSRVHYRGVPQANHRTWDAGRLAPFPSLINLFQRGAPALLATFRFRLFVSVDSALVLDEDVLKGGDKGRRGRRQLQTPRFLPRILPRLSPQLMSGELAIPTDERRSWCFGYSRRLEPGRVR